ncbi:MAG: hypothetical protein GTO18_20310 [Anaerolineales bacterium]|nr:hypothetical protein [Anaerolineales bacterium]
MNTRKRIFIILLVVFGLIYQQLRQINEELLAVKIPHYEVGDKKGEKFFSQCLREIYDEWRQNSTLTLATNREGFLQSIDLFMMFQYTTLCWANPFAMPVTAVCWSTKA